MRLGTSLKITEFRRVGGSVPVFSPSDISDMKCWWDAALGIALNGANVSEWEDQSGNGNDIVQTIATDQPLYNVTDSDFNNLPSINFNGIDEGMAFLAFSGGRLSQPLTHVIVLKSNTTATTRSYYMDSGDGNSFRCISREEPSGNLSMFAGSVQDSGDLRLTSSNVLYFQYDSGSINSGIWRNGVPLITDINCGSNDYEGVSLARRGSNDSNNGAFDVAEILVYEKALTVSEKNDLGNYLQAKYSTAAWTPVT